MAVYPGNENMDEWDEFLSKSEKIQQNTEIPDSPVIITPKSPSELFEFEDNAEILVQIAGGESLNSLLSPNGVWIKSPGSLDPRTAQTKSPSLNNTNSKKRSLQNHGPSTVPVANTLQDLSRAIIGHPTLSHPLSLLKQHYQSAIKLACPFYEIDSIGIFFYGTVGEIHVETNARDDMMKAIPLKRKLINSSLLNSSILTHQSSYNYYNLDTSFKFILSHDNLKILADSLPPNGKSSWIIPFSVKDGRVDLSVKGLKTDQLALFYDYLALSVQKQILDLLDPSIHIISLVSEGIQIAVKTVSPALNVSIGFRGAFHSEPAAQATDFLFSRQSNYSIEVDFENGPLRCTAIKSFVPKLDSQNRLFLLLKALANKLPSLPDGTYFLAHLSNTPIIKIFSDSPVKSDQQPVNFDVFMK